MADPVMLDDWLDQSPRVVREILARYPVGTPIIVDDHRFFVIGATEEGELIVSPVRLSDDYDRAVAERSYVCPHCIAHDAVIVVQ